MNRPIRQLRPLVAAAIILTAAARVAASSPPDLSSAYVLPGISVSYNRYDAYKTFDGTDKYLRVRDAQPPVMYELRLGKRFGISEKWRWQLSADAGFGFTKDRWEFYDDVPFFDTTFYLAVAEHSLKRYSFSGGVLADAQYILSSSDRGTAYLSFGPGVHIIGDFTMFDYMDMDSEGYWYHGNAGTAISIGVGIGAERSLTNRTGVSAEYAFRLGFARYDKYGDYMYPMGSNYRYHYRSHALRIQFLLRPKPKPEKED